MYSYEILIVLLIFWTAIDFDISKHFAKKFTENAISDYIYLCEYRNKKIRSIRILALYVKENYKDLIKFVFGLIIYTGGSTYMFIVLHFLTYLVLEFLGINGSKIELDDSKEFTIYFSIFLSFLLMHCLIVLIYFFSKYRKYPI
jgi:hypothetical protein